MMGSRLEPLTDELLAFSDANLERSSVFFQRAGFFRDQMHSGKCLGPWPATTLRLEFASSRASVIPCMGREAMQFAKADSFRRHWTSLKKQHTSPAVRGLSSSPSLQQLSVGRCDRLREVLFGNRGELIPLYIYEQEGGIVSAYTLSQKPLLAQFQTPTLRAYDRRKGFQGRTRRPFLILCNHSSIR